MTHEGDIIDPTRVLAGGAAVAFTAVNCSSIVQNGTTHVLIEVHNLSGSAIDFHYRKTGGTEIAPIAIAAGYSETVKVGLNSSYTFDYYLSAGSVDIWIIEETTGYVSGAVTYTTAAKVSSLLRLINTSTQARKAFSVSTDPTLAEVEAFISEAESDIDKETNHAWRAVTVTDEYYNLSDRYDGVYRRELPLKLRHRKIRTFVSGTDKIEYWNGTSWIEMVATLTEGRANDFWCDYTNGIIYFVNTKPYYDQKGVRVTYRYGDSSVPGAIQECATKLTAIKLLENEDYKMIVPETTDKYALASKVESWKRDVERILNNYKELILA